MIFWTSRSRAPSCSQHRLCGRRWWRRCCWWLEASRLNVRWTWNGPGTGRPQ